jgi:hypothetical protein
VTETPDIFAREEEDSAMVRLGVGKNMVRAIRFWADAADVTAPSPTSGLTVTEFGEAIFGSAGLDEYLEDVRTLWLLHWKLASSPIQPLFAWHYLLNFWHRPEFTASEALAVLSKEAQRLGKKVSSVTLDHHFNTFLHTYVPTRSKKGEVLEDNLDCPLVELELIETVGERAEPESNRRELIYAFRVEEKPEISAELFIYCLDEFWTKRHAQDLTLSFREIAVGEGSPGQVFKLPEQAIRERLESIQKDSGGKFDYRDSAALPQVTRIGASRPGALLRNIYRRH